MKKQTLFFILLLSLQAFGQREIQVTKNSTVMLVFAEPVSSHTIGDIYEYIVYQNKSQDPISKKVMRLGYNIRGRGGSKTSLSVVTEDGLLYEFILSYTDSIPKLTHQIPKTEAIADISGTNGGSTLTTPEPVTVEAERDTKIQTVNTPASSYSEGTQTKSFDMDKIAGIDPATITDNKLYNQDKESYIYLQCKNTRLRKKRISRTFGKSYNALLRLKSVNYDKDELYLYLSLENDGAQAYDVDFVKFAIATIKKGIRTAQEPPHIPPYIYNSPKRIEGHVDHHFVVVFDKFQLGREKELWIEIRENNGERNLVLKIDHKIINNPRKF